MKRNSSEVLRPAAGVGGAWGQETPRRHTPGRFVVTDWGVSTNARGHQSTRTRRASLPPAGVNAKYALPSPATMPPHSRSWASGKKGPESAPAHALRDQEQTSGASIVKELPAGCFRCLSSGLCRRCRGVWRRDRVRVNTIRIGCMNGGDRISSSLRSAVESFSWHPLSQAGSEAILEIRVAWLGIFTCARLPSTSMNVCEG